MRVCDRVETEDKQYESGKSLVDHPTQLICFLDFYLLSYKIQNTKDIAGQSATIWL